MANHLCPFESDDPTVRVSVNIEETLHDHLKRIAALNDTTLADAVRHALWTFAMVNSGLFHREQHVITPIKNLGEVK